MAKTDTKYIHLAGIASWVLALGLILPGREVRAQQEPQYTQFMFNKLAYNPGYAGSFVSPEITAIYRNQWMGIEGAPKTQILSFNMPVFNEHAGMGANLTHNSIGINRSTTVDMIFAWRFKTRRGHLSFGVQPSIRNFYQNWADGRLYSPTPAGTDLAIPLEPRTKWIIDLGLGLFFSNDEKGWYAGLALPRGSRSSIDFAENGATLSREAYHFNAMAGLTISASDDLKFMPQMLLKFVPNTPFEAELNVMAAVRKKIYSGVTYRAGGDVNGAGESVDVLLGVQATSKLFLCLSYDIGLTSLRKFHNGSVEATVRWWINPPEGTDVQSGYGF